MERTTFGLLFYIRRDKTNKKGEAPVFMRLTINGERADASIKTLHRAARLELGKRKSQRKKPRRKGFEPVPGRYFRQHSADSKGPRTRQERGLRPNHSEPLSGEGAVGPSYVNGGFPRPQRKMQGAVGYQPRPGNGDPLRNHATADRGVSAKELSKRGLLSG